MDVGVGGGSLSLEVGFWSLRSQFELMVRESKSMGLLEFNMEFGLEFSVEGRSWSLGLELG